jgi:hypothetical protein
MSVAFVREESAEAAQEVSLPPRISPYPNLVTQSGLSALERALAESHQALKTAQAIEDANERRRALELATRDARYFADPRGESIAHVSPLAHRLIGKQVGEAVEMDGREIEVVAVE